MEIIFELLFFFVPVSGGICIGTIFLIAVIYYALTKTENNNTKSNFTLDRQKEIK